MHSRSESNASELRDDSKFDDTSMPSETDIDKSHPVVIGLFGSDNGDDLKNRFFEILCGSNAPTNAAGSSSVQRGQLSIDKCSDRNIQVWKFPSLHEGTWLERAEAFLCVTAHLKACNGNLQGAVYAYGLDDDEDDGSNGAFQLFRSLMGDDTLSKSTIIISSDPGEPTIDLENALEPPAPFSPRSPTPRRRPVTKLSGLASELAQVRRQFDELQDAYAALESNCAEQTTQLEESVLELRTRDGGLRAENDSLRAEISALNATLNELRPKPRQNQVVSRDNAVQTDPPPEEKPTRSDMQAEALSLKTQLAESKLAEAKAIKGAANLSEELTKAKSPLMEVQRANAELKKNVGLLEKQAENTTKTIEAKKDERRTRESPASTKESAAAKSKLEDERSKAISVSESALKAKENVEKELVKEYHIGEIARAAEVWTLASAEAKSLKEELKLLQTCADARQREIQTELCEARDEYKRATIEWDLERTRLDSSILALTQTGEKARSDLDRTIEL
ncbi:hypothetical protein RHS01_00256 [Rhizoctonia solani]|uniref:Uncharacterized protein n=1 Tax=Rhizoctonia solani TaxID=456999 RepID=A0A8H7IJZ2_9AGAM|nr:hypothetical protein RHS01_00256 [Rhizoctonia solani]